MTYPSLIGCNNTDFDASRREDLIDVVTNVSPKETPLLSGLPMGSPAKSTLHEWTTVAFDAAADNATAEGSAFAAVALTQPTRANNITQIFKDSVQVSGTEVAVNGVTEPYQFQIQKNLVEHAKDKLFYVLTKLSYIGETSQI